jgi:hypothetical protein
METMRDWKTPAAAAAGMAIGVFGALQFLSEVPPWVQHLIEMQGSDFLVAFILLGAAIYFAPRFLQAQTHQAIALASLADAVKNLPQKDQMKFEEILIGQEMLHRSVERLHARLDKIAGEYHG